MKIKKKSVLLENHEAKLNAEQDLIEATATTLGNQEDIDAPLPQAEARPIANPDELLFEHEIPEDQRVQINETAIVNSNKETDSKPEEEEEKEYDIEAELAKLPEEDRDAYREIIEAAYAGQTKIPTYDDYLAVKEAEKTQDLSGDQSLASGDAVSDVNADNESMAVPLYDHSTAPSQMSEADKQKYNRQQNQEETVAPGILTGLGSLLGSGYHALFTRKLFNLRKNEFENNYSNFNRSADAMVKKMKEADATFLKTSGGNKIKELAAIAGMSVNDYVGAIRNQTLKPAELQKAQAELNSARSDPSFKTAWEQVESAANELKVTAAASAKSLDKLHRNFSDTVDTDRCANALAAIKKRVMDEQEPLGNPDDEKAFKERLESMMKSIQEMVERILNKLVSTFSK